MKLTDAQKKRIRESAMGEKCTIQISGICNGNPETVVLCHLPDESRGMALKSFDLSSAYGCSSCHNEIDRRTRAHHNDDMDFYMRRAQTRTIKRLLEKGILKII